MFDGLKTFGCGLVSLVLGLVVIIVGINLVAMALGIFPWDYMLLAAATVVLVGGALLKMQGYGSVGTPFIICAVLTGTGVAVSHRMPGVYRYFTQTKAEVDRTANNAAIRLETPRLMPCDRTTPNILFFEQGTLKPLVYTAENDKGRILCYDRPGNDPRTNKEYVGVDPLLVAAILRQEPLTPPKAPETPIVAPSPSPSPVVAELEELGEGPITDHSELQDLSEGPISR